MSKGHIERVRAALMAVEGLGLTMAQLRPRVGLSSNSLSPMLTQLRSHFEVMAIRKKSERHLLYAWVPGAEPVRNLGRDKTARAGMIEANKAKLAALLAEKEIKPRVPYDARPAVEAPKPPPKPAQTVEEWLAQGHVVEKLPGWASTNS